MTDFKLEERVPWGVWSTWLTTGLAGWSMLVPLIYYLVLWALASLETSLNACWAW